MKIDEESSQDFSDDDRSNNNKCEELKLTVAPDSTPSSVGSKGANALSFSRLKTIHLKEKPIKKKAFDNPLAKSHYPSKHQKNEIDQSDLPMERINSLMIDKNVSQDLRDSMHNMLMNSNEIFCAKDSKDQDSQLMSSKINEENKLESGDIHKIIEEPHLKRDYSQFAHLDECLTIEAEYEEQLQERQLSVPVIPKKKIAKDSLHQLTNALNEKNAYIHQLRKRLAKANVKLPRQLHFAFLFASPLMENTDLIDYKSELDFLNNIIRESG